MAFSIITPLYTNIYLFGHQGIEWVMFWQPLHLPGARLVRGGGDEAGSGGAAGGGAGGSGVSIGCSISSKASWIDNPLSRDIRQVDRVRFCFCFSFTARNSLTSFVKRVVECIVILQALRTWLIAWSSGLGGLFDRCLRKALIDEACFAN